jgi:uncharacterized membrane protein
MSSPDTAERTTLNARVSAWCLVTGAISALVLSLQSQPLAPLRLLTLAVITIGAWAFCDEMGMRKPLVRAGFVSYSIAVLARSIALIEPHSQAVGRYYLLYAFAILSSLLIWSVAYLHRQRDLKVAGAVGALVSVAPIVALVAGHIAVGAGAAFGISSLLAATEGAPLSDFSAVNNIDYIFGIWGFVTAWFLLSGRIRCAS